jgi:2-polyprenyl-3-methyl-5-hydroxy-6-metoxy-1,4-benzoquinol methylase
MSAMLTNAAAEVAERFKHFRTPRNGRFFDALANHLSGINTDPCLPMYFEYTITCNQRGRQIAALLEKYTGLHGKRYLDLGCAYGGFLVAFAEKGADVTGIDLDAGLLDLGRNNLLDHNLDAPLLLRDITKATDLQEFQGTFDVITCNDVIEHVGDPEALVFNVANLMHHGSLAYFEIPNRYHPSHVLKDGHYQLFGITLLDNSEALEYHSLHAPGVPYTVGHYLEIDQYTRMFERNGLRFSILDESFANATIDTVLNNLGELRAYVETGLNEVAPTRSNGIF